MVYKLHKKTNVLNLKLPKEKWFVTKFLNLALIFYQYSVPLHARRTLYNDEQFGQ